MLKRFLTLSVSILLACTLALAVGASQKVKIVGKNFVADTFWDVPVYYEEGEDGYYGRWQCFEYVQRFYREAYDLVISAYEGCAAPKMETPGYGFQKTKTPKPGDLLYSPAARRGKPYSHWAVVKTCANGTVTLAEQNHHWNGAVVVDRETPIIDAEYDFFTPIGIGGPNPQLGGEYQSKIPQEQQPKTQNVILLWIEWFRQLWKR